MKAAPCSGWFFLGLCLSMNFGIGAHGFLQPIARWESIPTNDGRTPRLLQLNLMDTKKEYDLLEEAARIRREAREMDIALTKSKHEQLKKKISRLRKTDMDVSALEIELNKLEDKLLAEGSPVDVDVKPVNHSIPSISSSRTTVRLDEASSSPAVSSKTLSPTTIATKKSQWKPRPFQPFDEEDLEAFLPVAKALDLPPETDIEDQLNIFRNAPELQDFFRQKLTQLIMEPLQEIQQLQELKSDYLQSTSATEKKQLKREIDNLAKRLDATEWVPEVDVIFLDIPPISDEELSSRIHQLESYPPVLQAIFKSKHSQQGNPDPTLSILLDYYEEQLHVLEDVHRFSLVDRRDEVQRAVESLPDIVRSTYASAEIGLTDTSVQAVTDALVKQHDGDLPPHRFMPPIVLETGNDDEHGSDIFSDVEFLDRSRFVSELYPAVARLEPKCPSMEEVMTAVAATSFRMRGPPERVLGGWYVRGEATERILDEFNEQKDSDLCFYYILDPSPPTDEQVEMDEADPEPLLLITAHDDTGVGVATWTTKLGVSILSLFSLCIFGVLVVGSDRAPLVVLGILAIQAAHELGHHAIAFRDKFAIGWPTLVPSTQIGTMGAITPILTAPPTMKSLFDFSLAGPLAGGLLSLAMFVQGLYLDPGIGGGNSGIPSSLLRSSALGGGLIEYVMGSGSLLGETISLHPLATAGFCGLVANAVAMLPLGNTDGGRVSLAMFGRRGSYIVKTFTTALLCLAGIVGLDETGWLLTYALFATIWQRESEKPMKNEVVELDFARGAVGIGAALVVALIIIPMQ